MVGLRSDAFVVVLLFDLDEGERQPIDEDGDVWAEIGPVLVAARHFGCDLERVVAGEILGGGEVDDPFACVEEAVVVELPSQIVVEQCLLDFRQHFFGVAILGVGVESVVRFGELPGEDVGQRVELRFGGIDIFCFQAFQRHVFEAHSHQVHDGWDFTLLSSQNAVAVSLAISSSILVKRCRNVVL